jgi:hypothetical protein
MNSKMLKNTLTAVLFACVFGIALRELQLTRLATADLALALARKSELERTFGTTLKLEADAARRNSELSEKLALLRAAKTRLSSYDGDLRILAAIAKPWREIVLNRDPKLQAMFLRSERVAIPLRYASFVAAQGLAPNQARSLEDAVMAATERSLDIKSTAEAQGLSQTDPAVSTILNQSEQNLKNTVNAILGDDGYEKLQDYQRTLPTRDFVNTLAGELAFSDSPLTGEQADLLVSELAAANASYQNGGVAVSPRFNDYMEPMATKSLAQDPIAWDLVESQVQGQLSETQFELLKSAMQDTTSTIQLYNMMQQASDAPLLGFSYSRKTK